MQFCGFFSTFRQNDIILKAPLFSKKNFREKTTTKSFFFFQKLELHQSVKGLVVAYPS